MRSLNRGFLLSFQAAAMACCVSFGASAAAPAAKPAAPAAAKSPAIGSAAAPDVAKLLPDYAKDDPAKVAAARAFLIAYHPNLDPAKAIEMLDKMMPRMVAAQKRDNPKIDVVKYEKETRARLVGRFNGSLDLQSHVISRHFTLQELKDLQAFFTGPLGKKLVVETALIKRDMRLIRRPGMAKGNPAIKVTPVPKKN